MAEKRYKGRITSVVLDKGFGFISAPHTGESLFFHASGCSGVRLEDLEVGDKVSFYIIDSDKGLRAVKVKLLADVEEEA